MTARGGVERLLSAVNLAPQRRPPFVTRRYPFRGHERMLQIIGPDLATETTWTAADTPPQGELAKVFAQTGNVHKWVHYLPIYETVLAEYRSRPITMLEIGVARGGSLQMWRRYLHPKSTLLGVDINPECQRSDDPAQNIHVRIGNQQDTTFLRDITREFGPFHVILDDGSHTTSHMVDTFRYLFPNALVDGGAYIVEDIHSNYWKECRDSAMSFVEFTKWLIDAMHAHYHVTESETEFRSGDPDRRSEIRVPAATQILAKIEFYDSIAILHRARRELPRTISQ